jgi:hypothetical protein
MSDELPRYERPVEPADPTTVPQGEVIPYGDRADDIIDKATISQAVSESALVIGRVATARFVDRFRTETGDLRPVSDDVQVVSWVTPLVKASARPRITPFAGLTVTSVHLDPPGLGVDGLGVVAFRSC